MMDIEGLTRELPILSTPDDLERLGIAKKNTQAVWRSTGRYDFPFIRSGRRILYERGAIIKWLAGRTVDGKQQ